MTQIQGSDQPSLFIRRDIRFTVRETATAVGTEDTVIRNWINRDLGMFTAKDARLHRLLFDATEVLKFRLMADLQRRCGLELTKSGPIAHSMALAWFQYHAMFGLDGPLQAFIVAGKDPFFQPLVTVPSAPAAVRQELSKDRDEIMSGPHIMVPLSKIASEVNDRLLEIHAANEQEGGRGGKVR